MFATDRTRLRAKTPDDAEAMFDLRSDPETHLLAEDEPMLPISVASIRARLEKDLEEPNDGTHWVGFAIESVADGRLVGSCSLWGIDSFNRTAHIGISMRKDVRGKGHGRDAVALLCRYGFRMRNMQKIELETLGNNTAMSRVAEACGFTLEGRLRQRAYDGETYQDMLVYGILRSEWEQSR